MTLWRLPRPLFLSDGDDADRPVLLRVVQLGPPAPAKRKVYAILLTSCGVWYLGNLGLSFELNTQPIISRIFLTCTFPCTLLALMCWHRIFDCVPQHPPRRRDASAAHPFRGLERPVASARRTHRLRSETSLPGGRLRALAQRTARPRPVLAACGCLGDYPDLTTDCSPITPSTS